MSDLGTQGQNLQPSCKTSVVSSMYYSGAVTSMTCLLDLTRPSQNAFAQNSNLSIAYESPPPLRLKMFHRHYHYHDTK